MSNRTWVLCIFKKVVRIRNAVLITRTVDKNSIDRHSVEAQIGPVEDVKNRVAIGIRKVVDAGIQCQSGLRKECAADRICQRRMI
ncbi:MAG: hypothetical protein ABGZ24_22290, partial [Fuerstiella sp.]